MPIPRRRPDRVPVVLRGVAAAVLVCGWFGSAYVATRPPEASDADAVEYQIVGNHAYPITLAESRREKQIVQRMEGNFGVWIAEFDAGLRSNLRPPRLAWTLLALSTAIGLGCLGLAKSVIEDHVESGADDDRA